MRELIVVVTTALLLALGPTVTAHAQPTLVRSSPSANGVIPQQRLRAGTYQIIWRVIGDDGKRARGAYDVVVF